jgi:hypothetical protein
MTLFAISSIFFAGSSSFLLFRHARNSYAHKLPKYLKAIFEEWVSRWMKKRAGCSKRHQPALETDNALRSVYAANAIQF